MLPVLPELADLLPERGLRRGSTIAVGPGASPGATTIMLALLAAASKAGSWCAIVGVPYLGIIAAAELGIALERTALVPYPGAAQDKAVATLLDGFDIVVTATAASPPPAATRAQLAARTRQSGSVLIAFQDQPDRPAWEGADLYLTTERSLWHGLGPGHGRLRGRQLTVIAKGKGSAVRPRQATIWLPKDPDWTPPADTIAPRPTLRLVT